MTDRYRLVDKTHGYADPNLEYSRAHAHDIAKHRSEFNPGHDWCVQYRRPGSVIWHDDVDYAEPDETIRRALTDLAGAMRDAGKDRTAVHASLALTTRDRYTGVLDAILDEVFATPPKVYLDLGATFGSTVSVLDTITALNALSDEFHAAAAQIRPVDDGSWDRDDEEADNLADAYDECATRVLTAFGLTEKEA